MRVMLVTGAAGLLGRWTASWLLQSDYQVVGIDNLDGGYRAAVPRGVDLFEADAGNPFIWDDIFDRYPRIDGVYHFAAYASEGLSPFIRQFNYSNNLVVTANVVNQCIERDLPLVFTSSMAVYGEPTRFDIDGRALPFTEADPCRPHDPYGIAKYACEQDIRVAGDQHGLRYTILRPHNVYGPFQNIWDGYRNVLGIWQRQILADEPLTVYGSGDQTRAFSNIAAMRTPMLHAMTRAQAGDQLTVNLGSPHAVTINEAANITRSVCGVPDHPIEHLEPRHEVAHATCTTTKSELMLGYSPHREPSLSAGIAEMWEWSSRQGANEVKTMPYEITKGLYSFWR